MSTIQRRCSWLVSMLMTGCGAYHPVPPRADATWADVATSADGATKALAEVGSAEGADTAELDTPAAQVAAADAGPDAPGTLDAGPANSPAVLGTKLVHDCFGFPGQDFAPGNHPDYALLLGQGAQAVDFTLREPDGTPRTLRELLETAPVLLVTGSATCNIYRAQAPLYEQITQKYKGKLQVVMVYTVEAHPLGPDTSPYSGTVWPDSEAPLPQTHTWAERAQRALALPHTGGQRLLIDETEAGTANPFWCTYGTLPAGAWLVAQDGTVVAAMKGPKENPIVAMVDAWFAP